MASPRNYADKLQSDDFDQLFREATHPKEKLRFLAFVHLKDGQSARTVANTVQVDQSSVHRWLRNYQAKGVDGLREQPGRGRKALMTDSELQDFRLAVLELQQTRDGGVIIGQDVLQLIERKYNKVCSLKSAYNLLNRASLVWISSRSKHPNSDQMKQQIFKKNSKNQ